MDQWLLRMQRELLDSKSDRENDDPFDAMEELDEIAKKQQELALEHLLGRRSRKKGHLSSDNESRHFEKLKELSNSLQSYHGFHAQSDDPNVLKNSKLILPISMEDLHRAQVPNLGYNSSNLKSEEQNIAQAPQVISGDVMQLPSVMAYMSQDGDRSQQERVPNSSSRRFRYSVDYTAHSIQTSPPNPLEQVSTNVPTISAKPLSPSIGPTTTSMSNNSSTNHSPVKSLAIDTRSTGKSGGTRQTLAQPAFNSSLSQPSSPLLGIGETQVGYSSPIASLLKYSSHKDPMDDTHLDSSGDSSPGSKARSRSKSAQYFSSSSSESDSKTPAPYEVRSIIAGDTQSSLPRSATSKNIDKTSTQ